MGFANPAGRPVVFHPVLVEKDIAITLRDGGTILANVFRPGDEGEFPVIITLGPYPKDVHFSDWNPAAGRRLPEHNEHMHWETVDPEWWGTQGDAVVGRHGSGAMRVAGPPS